MQKSGFQIYKNEWWHYNLEIFKYDGEEIIGAESVADKKYPKIPEGEFLDLLTPKVKKNFLEKFLNEKKFDEKDKKEISDRIGLFSEKPNPQIADKNKIRLTKLFERECQI
jgi:hypothetical protein